MTEDIIKKGSRNRKKKFYKKELYLWLHVANVMFWWKQGPFTGSSLDGHLQPSMTGQINNDP